MIQNFGRNSSAWLEAYLGYRSGIRFTSNVGSVSVTLCRCSRPVSWSVTNSRKSTEERTHFRGRGRGSHKQLTFSASGPGLAYDGQCLHDELVTTCYETTCYCSDMLWNDVVELLVINTFLKLLLRTSTTFFPTFTLQQLLSRWHVLSSVSALL